MKKKVIIPIVIVLCLFIFFFVAPLIVAKVVNDKIFKKRSEVNDTFKLSISDYPNLKVENISFKSNNNQLQGYLYSSDTLTPKGVVIYSHGFNCGGSNSTMMFADFFVSNDYYYFTYDATANGLSEGTNQKGLVQGVLDLDKAISCVKANDKLKNYPIMLLGHSWGGYNVCSVVKYHPDVKAVCSISGFINANDLMVSSAKKKVGSFLTNASKPYLDLYERFIFGSKKNLNGLDGLKSSECKCLIIHSSDDRLIETKYGYDKYYNEFKDDPRFSFKLYTNRQHGYIFLNDEARNMVNAYMDEGKSFNKELYINGLDIDMFNQILDLYNNSLNN